MANIIYTVSFVIGLFAIFFTADCFYKVERDDGDDGDGDDNRTIKDPRTLRDIRRAFRRMERAQARLKRKYERKYARAYYAEEVLRVNEWYKAEARKIDLRFVDDVARA